jgi:hypothetical protein
VRGAYRPATCSTVASTAPGVAGLVSTAANNIRVGLSLKEGLPVCANWMTDELRQDPYVWAAQVGEAFGRNPPYWAPAVKTDARSGERGLKGSR